MGGKDKSTFNKILMKVTHQSEKSQPGLKKYELIVIGGHIGGILTKHFERFDHGMLNSYSRSHFDLHCLRCPDQLPAILETILRDSTGRRFRIFRLGENLDCRLRGQL